MAEERTPEEEEMLRRLAGKIKKEKPKGVGVKKNLIVISLLAVMGAYAALMATGGSFQLNDVTIENFEISMGRLTASGLVTPRVIDNKNILELEASVLEMENVHMKMAKGVVELRAAEGYGRGGLLKIEWPYPFPEGVVGTSMPMEIFVPGGTMTNITNYKVSYMHAESTTFRGIEINIS